jgi:hypothetical protein
VSNGICNPETVAFVATLRIPNQIYYLTVCKATNEDLRVLPVELARQQRNGLLPAVGIPLVGVQTSALHDINPLNPEAAIKTPDP